MKITFDTNDANEVAEVLNLLNGGFEETVQEPEPVAAPAPTRAPPGRAAPAGRAPAPNAAPAGRGAPAAGRPAPGRAPSSAPAPSAPAGGVSKDELAAQVQAFAKAYGPAAAKSRFAEYGTSIGAAVTNISGIPTDDYENAMTWFAVEG